VPRWAVVAFPPPADVEAIEAIRRQHDPLCDQLPAHLTLVFPFESGLSSVDIADRVQRAASPVTAFSVTFGPVAVHDQTYLFSEISAGADAVVELHRRLYEQLTPLGATLIGPFVPHITVGRLSTSAAADAAALELAPTFAGGSTTVATVSLYDIDQHRGRAVRASVPLKALNR
jgi:2'-5' RNA ligase